MIPERTRPQLLVLDTNVVLDLLVFGDPATQPLQAALASGQLDWLATPAMRDELLRVLDYPHIAPRLASSGLAASEVLLRFDRQARIVEAPARAPVSCSDPDDQKFIDLAVRHQCLLLSKDAAVLALGKKLAALQVDAVAAMPPA
ncbi:MAG TPA: putative toxin-antitoxin system toxin component, PIN family [Ramlibacter sp.]|nr:putative toxin-antitoxin system toxin component, PIN family [Ramlibacter sp.]